MQIDNNYCVILAGGKGRRLWPCSRQNDPKQFLDFFGLGKTQLQQTYERAAQIVPPQNIFINTNHIYVDKVKEQLPQVDAMHIMAEPIWRNTAPSVAWACHRVASINPDANLVVMPSDQAIYGDDVFRTNMLNGMEFVSSHDCLLTMGIKPTRPEPGYGYIQLGDPECHDVYKVKSFTEKPDRDFAQMFMESGEWCWNTGLFLFNVRYGLRCFSNLFPMVLRNFDKLNPNWSSEEENRYVDEHFPLYPNVSMEYGVLEKCEDVYVMRCNFGWADLGTWHGIYEALPKGNDDNVVIDSDVMIDNAKDNIIKLPKNRLAVINGLDGYIVAEENNVLLICKKEDSSALIRKYVAEISLKKGEKFV